MQNRALSLKYISDGSRQRGVVLFVTLIALLIIMLTSVALIRSTDANLQIAGTMAFKSDLRNQAERAIPAIQTKFQSAAGGLYSVASRENDSAANNYYATVQASNDSGIPNVLLANAMDTNANNIVDSASKTEIRYVIDRMCLATGSPRKGVCTMAASDAVAGCTPENCDQVEKTYPVYRITLRAIGPRNTEVYLQTTFSD